MDNPLLKAVASAVTTARKRAGLSQEQLASHSKLDRTYISGIERGVRNITLCSLERVVEGLGMDLAEFLREVIDELELSQSK